MSSPPSSPPVEDLICLALHAAARASEASYKPVLAPFKLTYPQYLVLLVLWEADGVSVGDICKRLFLDSGTLTPMLKRLETQGMVARRRDGADERVVRVYLTAGGRGLRAPIAEAVRAMACRLNMSQSDVGDLRDRIYALRRRIQAASPFRERQ